VSRGAAGRKRPAPTRAAKDGAFPLRVAAIDVGSSAIRFVAAEFSGPDKHETLLSLRVPVRLGHGVFLSGRLAPRTVDSAVRALASFRSEMEKLRIRDIRAVATSAVRESENGGVFVDRAAREAGVEVEIISGSEEARLVHLAVCRRIPLGRRRWVLADLGGGSIEVSLADADGIQWSESHTMGAVRLVEELSEAGQTPAAFERLLAEYVGTLHLPKSEGRRRYAGLIATGGNIEALATLAGVPVGPQGAILALAAMRRMIGVLSRLSYRQRISDLGLREDRADVILPAAMVYERVAALVGARDIRVPFVGLKDGLLFDLVDRLSARSSHEDHRQRLVREGALALGRRFSFDEPHGRHVMLLALSLFDQLAALHGMGPRERSLLLAAGLLHDLGAYISFKRHHRHSMYLLAQSELPGLTPRDMQLVANLARYHRKSEPRVVHPEFARLDEADRKRVIRLAALLRLADALDREHRQRVHGIRVRTSGREVRVSLDGRGDLLLERWALRRKVRLFERAFGVKVQFRGDGGAA
jgi:exopolyphosphatase/guanosine-5'-triphosphate,3'-diphosphate pyrophosphatase